MGTGSIGEMGRTNPRKMARGNANAYRGSPLGSMSAYDVLPDNLCRVPRLPTALPSWKVWEQVFCQLAKTTDSKPDEHLFDDKP